MVMEPATAGTADAGLRSRIREPQDPFLRAPSRSKSPAATPGFRPLQKRWEKMRQVIDECAARAEFGDVPGGATGLLIKDHKGKDADQPVYKVDSGLLPSCAPTSIGRPRNWSSGRPPSRSASPSTPFRRRIRWPN
jgi:hypothetical protein